MFTFYEDEAEYINDQYTLDQPDLLQGIQLKDIYFKIWREIFIQNIPYSPTQLFK